MTASVKDTTMKIKRFFKNLIDPFPSSVSFEDKIINSAYANTTTPDQLIAAGIIQSIAKEFEDWELDATSYFWPTDKPMLKYKPANTKQYDKKGNSFRFFNKKKDLEIKGQYEYNTYYIYGISHSSHYYAELKVTGVVNDTELNGEDIINITTSFRKMLKNVKDAEEVAAKAKLKMEQEEKKWGLAEHILNMKRDGFGRLVPIDTCDHCGSRPEDVHNKNCPTETGAIIRKEGELFVGKGGKTYKTEAWAKRSFQIPSAQLAKAALVEPFDVVYGGESKPW